MGSIGGLLGVGGGAGGSGFSAPQGTNILNPTTTAQANSSYGQNQAALQQQQALVQALQQQNGIQNQSNVFNQLQGVANGTGPNPAAAQLAQATGANISNQAALMAGQRGSGANAGLIARQAAMQGANTQQQAAGQAATMQANQSLNALGQLGSLANTQVAQQQQAVGSNTSANQNEQNNLLNSIAAQNTANVSMQNGINSANAGLAQTTMQGQQGLIGGALNGLGKGVASPFAQGGVVPRQMYASGTVDVQPTSPTMTGATDMSTVGAPQVPVVPAQPQITVQSTGPSSAFGSYIKNKSGDATAADFNYGNPGANQLAAGMSNLFSSFGTSGQGAPAAYSNANPIIAGGPQDNSGGNNNPINIMPNADQDTMMAAKGGKVPALVSKGEQYLKPKDVKKVVKEGKSPLKEGERIPGKPQFPGNDYRNDVVKKDLEPGGIIIPNAIMQSKDAEKKAAAFVKAHLAKRGSLPKKASK